jgi:hypothetical protein
MTRGLTGVLLRRRLLNPFRYGFYAVALASRKVLRRVVPLVFPPLLLVTVLLAPTGTFFAALAVAQVAFVALAFAGWTLRGTAVGKQPLFYVPFFFTLANVASMVALWNVLRGLRIERWTPQRHAPSTRATVGTGPSAEARAP